MKSRRVMPVATNASAAILSIALYLRPPESKFCRVESLIRGAAFFAMLSLGVVGGFGQRLKIIQPLLRHIAKTRIIQSPVFVIAFQIAARTEYRANRIP